MDGKQCPDDLCPGSVFGQLTASASSSSASASLASLWTHIGESWRTYFVTPVEKMLANQPEDAFGLLVETEETV